MQIPNHMPYDEGAVSDAFEQTFGIKLLTQTTKTMCGRRVVVKHADHKQPTTCDACRTELLRKWEGEKRLREALAALKIGE